MVFVFDGLFVNLMLIHIWTHRVLGNIVFPVVCGSSCLRVVIQNV